MTDPFPNDWREVAEIPSDRFVQVTFEEVMSKASSWELPNNVHAILRWGTTKIKEKAFSSPRTLGIKCKELEKALIPYTVMYEDEMFTRDFTS